MGGHQSANAIKYEWLTPPDLLLRLGDFDLDPCAPINRPWSTAKNHFTIQDDGLLLPWFGRVWLNPPYGKYLDAWMNKMAVHNCGIALIFARTETRTFHNYIFPAADSILFLKGRLKFYNVDGSVGKHDGGAPSILIAYGKENTDTLNASGISGKLILLNRVHVVLISADETWREVVKTALVNLNNSAELSEIYRMVEDMAPQKVKKNVHYRAKVRQVLQMHFTKIKRGQYAA